MLAIVFSIVATLLTFAAQAEVQSSWSKTKNVADDVVYEGHKFTFYCGCSYTSDGDNDGSGKPDLATCGYEKADKNKSRADSTEWEHIVPASLMPVRQMACWSDPASIPGCVSFSGNVMKGRACCEKASQAARNLIFDLHNLAPSIGQVNALRLNDRYGEIVGEERQFGICTAEDTEGLFEPRDDERCDAARVWLYMNWKHGVVIPDDELKMFIRWDRQDPVSAWERERDRRIIEAQGNGNPWVQ
jgi:deoxyribonuclease I